MINFGDIDFLLDYERHFHSSETVLTGETVSRVSFYVMELNIFSKSVVCSDDTVKEF